MLAQLEELTSDTAGIQQAIDGLNRRLQNIEDSLHGESAYTDAELKEKKRKVLEERHLLERKLDRASLTGRDELDRLKADIAGVREMMEIAGRKKAYGASMRQFSMNPEYAMTDEALAFVKSLHGPMRAKNPEDIQKALADILDRTDGKATVYPDRVDIEGLIPLTTSLHASRSGGELGGG